MKLATPMRNDEASLDEVVVALGEALEEVVVPLRASATFWNAEKLRAEFSSLFTALQAEKVYQDNAMIG